MKIGRRWPARSCWSPAERAASAGRRLTAWPRSVPESAYRPRHRTGHAAAAGHRRNHGQPGSRRVRRRHVVAGAGATLASQVLDAYPRLDVLINNVGGFWSTRRVTVDGLEHTFAVNHLAGSCSPICCSIGSRLAPRPGS